MKEKEEENQVKWPEPPQYYVLFENSEEALPPPNLSKIQFKQNKKFFCFGVEHSVSISYSHSLINSSK